MWESQPAGTLRACPGAYNGNARPFLLSKKCNKRNSIIFPDTKNFIYFQSEHRKAVSMRSFCPWRPTYTQHTQFWLKNDNHFWVTPKIKILILIQVPWPSLHTSFQIPIFLGNIIFPSTAGSVKLSLSFIFPYQNPEIFNISNCSSSYNTHLTDTAFYFHTTDADI